MKFTIENKETELKVGDLTPGIYREAGGKDYEMFLVTGQCYHSGGLWYSINKVTVSGTILPILTNAKLENTLFTRVNPGTKLVFEA